MCTDIQNNNQFVAKPRPWFYHSWSKMADSYELKWGSNVPQIPLLFISTFSRFRCFGRGLEVGAGIKPWSRRTWRHWAVASTNVPRCVDWRTTCVKCVASEFSSWKLWISWIFLCVKMSRDVIFPHIDLDKHYLNVAFIVTKYYSRHVCDIEISSLFCIK